MTTPIFKILGNLVPPPQEWRGIRVLATFDNSRENGVGSIQPNISTEQFTFVNETAVLIRDYIEAGLNGNGPGIFEGMDIQIVLSNGQTVDIFKGYIDLAAEYEELSPVKVKARIQKQNGLNSLFERSEANSFGFLYDQGVIVDGDFIDVEYVVEKEINFIELVITGVTLYLLIKELSESIRRIVGYVATIVGLANSATPPSTGIVGALLYAVAILILEIAYAAIIQIQIINLTKQIIEQFISPIRRHKGMRLETMFTKALSSFGYGFQTGISEMDWVYLPSAPPGGS